MRKQKNSKKQNEKIQKLQNDKIRRVLIDQIQQKFEHLTFQYYECDSLFMIIKIDLKQNQKKKNNFQTKRKSKFLIIQFPMTTPTLTSILETPQAFALQQILQQKLVYTQKLIDYISTPPDLFLMNQRECYWYPSKSVQILNMVGVYKQLVRKQQKGQKVVDVTKQGQGEYSYPCLERLFRNLKTIENQQILLGYVDRVLFSVTKKTPQIYQYFKDNQQSLLLILKNDKILFALKQFLTLFLTQSTMMLYVFLKNMVLRTLMFRIVENENTSPVVYEMLCDFYTQLLKAYVSQTSQEDKQQIIQVLKNIQQQNFIALLALKISPQHHRRTYFITKTLNQIATSPNNVSSLVTPYIDTYTQYLQSYQQSQDFMLVIMPDQLMMLKLILRICSIERQTLADVKEELVKRLLVYANIHERNSILHGMLFTIVQILEQQGNAKILLKAKIIEFLKNNKKILTSLNFNGLIKRICIFYVEHHLDEQLQSQEEKEFVRIYAKERKEKLAASKYFAQAKNQSQLFQANLSLLSEKSDKEEKKSENETASEEK